MVKQVVTPDDQNGGSGNELPVTPPNKNFLFTNAIVNFFKKIFLWIKNLFG